MNHEEELNKIKTRLQNPSFACGGRDAEMVRDIRWLIALVESQAKEIEQLKSCSSPGVTPFLRRA